MSDHGDSGRLLTLLDHFDRYASSVPGGEYNGSPFQAEVRAALRAERDARMNRRWLVQSDEDDGLVVDAQSALEAVKKWAASKWSDVDDGQRIEALDLALLRKFVARQTNEIAEDDLDTASEFEFVPDQSSGGLSVSTEPGSEALLDG